MDYEMVADRTHLYKIWLEDAKKDLVRANNAYVQDDSQEVFVHCQ
jgi:mevalonate pyrophosphate decarboxylase